MNFALVLHVGQSFYSFSFVTISYMYKHTNIIFIINEPTAMTVKLDSYSTITALR